MQQQAQSHGDICCLWGATNIDRTYYKSLLKTKPLLEKNLDGDFVGRIKADSFREFESEKWQRINWTFRILGLSRFQYREQNGRLFNTGVI